MRRFSQNHRTDNEYDLDMAKIESQIDKIAASLAPPENLLIVHTTKCNVVDLVIISDCVMTFSFK